MLFALCYVDVLFTLEFLEGAELFGLDRYWQCSSCKLSVGICFWFPVPEQIHLEIAPFILVALILALIQHTTGKAF